MVEGDAVATAKCLSTGASGFAAALLVLLPVLVTSCVASSCHVPSGSAPKSFLGILILLRNTSLDLLTPDQQRVNELVKHSCVEFGITLSRPTWVPLV